MRREREVNFARGSVRYDGRILSDEIEQLNACYIDGDIDSDELTAAILASETAHPSSSGREAALTFARIRELHRDPVQGRFDSAHLKEVHRRIFQDLPDHQPGLFRRDAPETYKVRELEATGEQLLVPYAPRLEIYKKLGPTLDALQGGEALRGFTLLEMTEAITQVHARVDYLRPFRTGNGRTLRTFTAQLSLQNGYPFDWDTANVTPKLRDRLNIARFKAVMELYNASLGRSGGSGGQPSPPQDVAEPARPGYREDEAGGQKGAPPRGMSEARERAVTRVSFEEIAENIESDLSYFHKQRWAKRAAELRGVVWHTEGEEQARAKQALREHYADQSKPETSRDALLEDAARRYAARNSS